MTPKGFSESLGFGGSGAHLEPHPMVCGSEKKGKSLFSHIVFQVPRLLGPSETPRVYLSLSGALGASEALWPSGSSGPLGPLGP